MKVPPATCLSLLILICSLSLLSEKTYAQKSAAELISEIAPPKGKVNFRDGVRQIAMRDHYLLVTNFWAGLQVIDIADLQHPQQIAFFRNTDEAFQTFVDGDVAYLANDKAGVQVFDLSDMNHVSVRAQITTPGNAYAVYAGYPHLFVALGDGGFAVMDVSDVQNTQTLRLEIPGDWVQHLTRKGDHLYLAAKKGGLIIYDISDLENPRKLSQFRTGYNTMMVQVDGDIAYLADGAGGMVAVNVANPNFPVEISRYSELGFVGNLFKSGNYVYLANQDLGLQIVNVTDPAHPFLESRYITSDKCYAVFKHDTHVFLAANTAAYIMRHNNAPRLEVIGDRSIPENQPFRIQMNAYEPDGDPILYQAYNLPEGSAFDAATGTFTWMPTYEQSGVYAGVVFRVEEETDSHLSAADTITITVEHVNRRPDLPAIAGQTVRENSLLTFAVPEGSDPDREDQGRLSYSAEKLPEGATFDGATRTFNWTPTYEQSGTYVVDFLMNDGAGGIDREPVTITVQHVDRPPVIDPIAAQSVDEAQTLTVAISGSEPDREDQDKISFVMKNLPQGARFDEVARQFSWTPTYDQSGEYPGIQAVMIAGALSDTATFSITVNHVNRPPVLAALQDQSGNENATLSFTVSGSDPDVEDAGKLIYAATNLPPGAVFDAASQVFSWTPDFEQSGEYPGIGFSVTDPAGLSDRKEIKISINHVNRPPQIAAEAAVSIRENEAWSLQLTGSDPDREDAGRLRFSAMSLPAGAQLDAQSGLLNWTPGYEQSGEYDVALMVSDGQLSDTTALHIFVQHVNRPPVLAEIPPQTVDESQPLQFTVNASDPDAEDQGQLSLSAESLPAGSAFDAATALFSWTPTFEQSGRYDVTFIVHDPAGLSDQKIAAVTVRHVNRAPAIAPLTAQTIEENSPLTVQLSGSDPDAEDAGKLTYSIDPLPEGALLNPTSGQFSWTPTFDQSGDYALTATVSDGQGLTAATPQQITVSNVNRPPHFPTPFAREGSENALLQFTVAAQDPDREDAGKLIYSALGLPEGASLNPATAEFSWTPTFEQSGDYSVNLEVRDSFGAGDQTQFAIKVANVNRAPQLPAITAAALRENETLQVTIPEGSDPDREDAGRLTYRVDNLPAGAQFDAATRTLSWTPAFDQSGNYQLSVVVMDAEGLSATQPMAVTVENVNRAPVLPDIPVYALKEGAAGVFTLPEAQDPDREDAGKLSYRVEGLPPGAGFEATGRTINWTPGYDQAGDYSAVLWVSDGAEEVSKEFRITVKNENRAPELSVPPGQTVSAGHELRFRVNFGDPDPEDAGKLQLEARNLPSGAEFNPVAAEFDWTPDSTQIGEYRVEFVVSDPQGLSASAAVTVQVEPASDVPPKP